MKKKFEMRIFLKYLITYLSLTLVFAGLLAVLYRTVYGMTRQNIIEDDTARTYEAVQMLDRQIETITTISEVIKNNEYFSRVSAIDGVPENKEYFYIYKAQEFLEELRQKYDMSLQIGVIFRNNSVMVSNSISSEQANQVFDNQAEYGNFSIANLRNEAFFYDERIRFMEVQQIALKSGQEGTLSLPCVMKIQQNNQLNADYAAVFFIDMEPILQLFDLRQGTKNEFLQISDNSGDVLFSYNCSPQDIFEGASDSMKIDGITYSVVKQKNTYENLKVVSGVCETAIKEKIQNVLKMIQKFIIAALIFSLLISFWFTYSRYRGISQILDVLRPKAKANREKNEYKLIRNTVEEIYANNERYEGELALEKNFIVNSLIEKMFVAGIYTEPEKAEFLHYIKQEIDNYCVVSIAFRHEFSEEPIHFVDFEKAAHFIKMCLEKQFDHVLIISRGSNEIICLIPVQGESPSSSEWITPILQKILLKVKQMFRCDVRSGISNIGYGIDCVHESYLQAKLAIRQISDTEGLVKVVTENPESSDNILEKFNLDQQLYSQIVVGDSEAVHKLFQRIQRYLKRISFIPEEDMMQIFFNIRNAVVRARQSIRHEEKMVKIPHYNSDTSMIQLLVDLEESSRELCALQLQNQEEQSKGLQMKVLQYLNENYSNPNLCVALVSDEIGISEKYIFAVVKKQTGMTFGQYVRDIRLKKAKKLLKNSEYTAAEIGEKVGFSSVTTFHKAFKREFGVAPIAWKENKTVQDKE
ncbi:MAG: helix-turn-helix domain-containing protein [Clostridia bacterium]|nr:helix-turn-helix domain-containing protein [Clostridia bacterium]